MTRKGTPEKRSYADDPAAGQQPTGRRDPSRGVSMQSPRSTLIRLGLAASAVLLIGSTFTPASAVTTSPSQSRTEASALTAQADALATKAAAAASEATAAQARAALLKEQAGKARTSAKKITVRAKKAVKKHQAAKAATLKIKAKGLRK